MSASRVIDIAAGSTGGIGYGSNSGAAFAVGNGGALNTWDQVIFGPNALLTDVAGIHYCGFWDGVEPWAHGGNVSDSGVFVADFEGGGSYLNANDGIYSQAYFFGHADSRPAPTEVCFDVDVDASTLAPSPIALLALGSRVLSKTGSFNASATGNLAVTGVGFTPEVVIFLNCCPLQSDGAGYGGDNFSLGAMDANGNQWALATRSYYFSGNTGAGAPVAGPLRYCQFRGDSCILAIGSAGDSIPTTASFQAAFVSMDADGFTVAFSAAGLDTSGNPSTIAYIALANGPGGHCRFAVGYATQPGAGDQAITGVGFQPDAVILASAQTTDGSVDSSKSHVSLGVSDGTTSRSTIGGGLGNTSATFNECYNRYWADALAFGTTGATLLAEAQLASFDVDGFTLDWTTSDSVARLFGYVAVLTDTNEETPVVETDAADGPACNIVTFNGLLTPDTDATDVFAFFEYGPTSGYGDFTPDEGPYGGFSPIPVTDTFAPGFASGHYRLGARYTNTRFGLTCYYYGADQTFAVGDCPPATLPFYHAHYAAGEGPSGADELVAPRAVMTPSPGSQPFFYADYSTTAKGDE